MLNLTPFNLPTPIAPVIVAAVSSPRNRGWRMEDRGWQNPSRAILYSLSAILVFILTGCASNKDAKAQLEEGYADLERQQYDAAIGKADAFLASNTSGGTGSAEALYL